MPKQKYRHYGFVLVLALVFSLGPTGTALASRATSAHYGVDETQFGAGADLNDCSTSYCARSAVGDLVDGTGGSTSYTAQFGAFTSEDPVLEVITVGGTQNVGVLDTNVTGTATYTVKVRNYLSNGYILQITGMAPTQGSHTLTALTTPTTSHQGAEQFGINFTANTSPSLGSNPVQVPSSAFSFGTVTSDYSGANLFKYINGDTVAQSTKSSGETDYTMSLIINVAGNTPGGKYNGSFSAVAVPVF